MSLKSKWIEMVYTVATGSRKVRNIFTPVGTLFFGLLIYFFVVIALHVDRLLAITDIFPGVLSVIIAVTVFSFALLLIGWSVFHFLRAKGTPVPFSPPTRLVATGPYAYVRNPMLSGVFGLLFGFGFLLGSASLLVVFTPLFIANNIWELKAIEEPELIKRPGENYSAYRKWTPMFLSGLGMSGIRKQS